MRHRYFNQKRGWKIMESESRPYPKNRTASAYFHRLFLNSPRRTTPDGEALLTWSSAYENKVNKGNASAGKITGSAG